MEDVWQRLRRELVVVRPAVLDTLGAGASRAELKALQQLFSVPLDELCSSLSIVNGQTSSYPPFWAAFSLMSADEIVATYRLINDEVVPDLLASGLDLHEGESQGPVKPLIWSAAWIPFADDGGNLLGLDTDPDEGGSIGQVFSWWRDGSANTWLAPSYRIWLEGWPSASPSG